MLQIELSALSAQELKRLLETARARNQPELAQQLIAELAARPTRADAWGQPAPPAYAAPAFEPEPDVFRPGRGVMVATAALAAFVSAAVTWGLSVPAAPPLRQAEPPPRAGMALASLTAGDLRPSLKTGSPAAVEAAPEPLEATRAPKPRPQRLARAAPAAKPKPNRCYKLPTAAERLVCGYPTLAARDRELRAAYERAVATGADRDEIDRAQAQWRNQSQPVADRQALADLYTRRIRELDAAKAKPPPPPPPPIAKPPADEPVF